MNPVTGQIANHTRRERARSLRLDSLLEKVRQTQPELPAEDAFVVPEWFSDQRSWVQTPVESNSVAYNLPLCLRLRGFLAYEALRQAFVEVQRRHQPLRSVFRFIEDQLVQIVIPPESLNVPLIDLVGESEPESRAQQFVLEQTSIPFHLDNEPGLRTNVLRLASDDHILLVVTHHLVCDDWSTGIFLRELFVTYRALMGNTKPSSEFSAFDYVKFIRWQEGQLSGETVGSRLAFWREYLAHRDDFHYLTADHRRAGRSFRGQLVRQVLPESLASSLRVLSQRERVSLFMTLLAGLLCVLHCYSRKDDIAVGSCAANRRLTEIEGLIGRFANDFVIRTDLSGNPSFRELFGRVRKQALTTYDYQDLPFSQVISERTHVDPSRSRLFQVMFILQDAPKERFDDPSLTAHWVPVDTGTSKYDLCFLINVQKGIEITLEFNTDLFEPSTISKVLSAYQETLSEMVSHPEARIDDLETLRGRMTSPPGPSRAVHTPVHTLSMPGDVIESKLVEIWERSFAIHPVLPNDDFFQLGGDSLLATQLFLKIDAVFGVKIPLVMLIQAPTIRQLSKVIRESVLRGRSRCVVPIQPSGSHTPLFLAHGQSGNLLMYRRLAQLLGPDHPSYGLQPRGMDGMQPPLTDIVSMAACYIDEIRMIQPRGPYFLAGYCMGGLIALEMAQQLRNSQEEIGLVALLDTYNVNRVVHASFSHLYFNLQKYWFGTQHLMRTNRKDKLAFVRRRFDELQIFDSEISKCNEQAAYDYIPKRYPGRILQVCPTKQYAIYQNPDLGWEQLATGGVQIYKMPIYPGQIFEEPFVRDLAAILKEEMRASAITQP